MSEITVSRPEVVNENTDVICSTSVRYRSLEYDNFPEISEANILSTFEPRFYVSTSKSIIKALINMHSFEIQL
ncbi:hypothetical protein ACEPQH_22020, partial [Escherichia coli]